MKLNLLAFLVSASFALVDAKTSHESVKFPQCPPLLAELEDMDQYEVGATLMLPWKAVLQGQQAYFQYIIKILNELNLSNIDIGSQAKLENNTWYIKEDTANFFMIPNLSDNQQLQIGGSGIFFGFHSESVTYDFGILGKIYGSLNAVIHNLQFQVDLNYGEEWCDATCTRICPTISHVIGANTVTIPDDSIEVSLYGDPLFNIVSSILPLFTGVIKQQIQSGIENQINSALCPQFDRWWLEQGGAGHYPVFNGIDYDYSLIYPLVMPLTGMKWRAKGKFFPESTGETPFLTPPAPLPVIDGDTSKMQLMQAFISPQTIDSLALSLVQTSPYDFWIQPTEVPASSPLKLDTTDLSIFFPGMSTKYGIGLPVSMKINIKKMSDFTSIEANQEITMKTTLDVSYYVHKTDGTQELACEMLFIDMVFGAQALIDNMVLRPKILSADLSTVQQVSSTFGDIDVAQITALFQQILAVSLAPMNVALNSFVLTIPDKIFGLFGLSELQINYSNTYVEVLLKPEFITPTFEAKEDL